MANNAAAEFLKKVISDKALKIRFADKDPAQAVTLAAELGFEVTEEELIAAKNELCRQNSSEVVELDESDMDRAAGGSRDWITQGCAATVEAGSLCWGTDYCFLGPVSYDHAPTYTKCPECGNSMYHEASTTKGGIPVKKYRCPKCGTVTEEVPVHSVK